MNGLFAEEMQRFIAWHLYTEKYHGGLYTANYTIANNRLAHYTGLIATEDFERLELNSSERSGINNAWTGSIQIRPWTLADTWCIYQRCHFV